MYYLNEHISCENYSYTVKNGFVFHSIPAGENRAQHKVLSDNLVFVISGYFLLSINSDAANFYGEGDFFYIPGGTQIDYDVKNDTRLLILSCASINLYEKLVELRPQSKIQYGLKKLNCKFKLFNQPVHLEQFLSTMCSYLNEGMRCRFLQEAKILEVLILLNMYYTEEELYTLFNPSEDIDDRVQFRIHVLREVEFSKNATELANRCGLGIRQFERKFLEVFETSPYQWMQDLKKNKLLDKLTETDLPIKCLVSDFGFCSVSHLNKFCQRYYGKNAAAFRKEYDF